MFDVFKTGDRFWFPCLGCWPKINVPNFQIETSANIYCGPKIIWLCKDCARELIEKLHEKITGETLTISAEEALKEKNSTKEELIERLQRNEKAYGEAMKSIVELSQQLEHAKSEKEE